MQETIKGSIGNYKIGQQIGRGTYGTVYKVSDEQLPNTKLVMKIIPIKHLKQSSQNIAFREITIMKTLNHPNIIKYYNSFLHEDNLYILMEEAERGDLYNYIKVRKQKKLYFAEEEIWKMVKDLLAGLQYLHSKNIMHRDIKSMNIFIMKNGQLKLGDMGVSKIIGSSLENTRVGTPLYLAPQLVRHQNYDFKADVWALGCIIYLVTTLQLPFNGKNLIMLGHSIVAQQPKKIGSQYSETLQNLINDLLEKIPSRRLTCEKILGKYIEVNRNIILKTEVGLEIPRTNHRKIKDRTESTKEDEHRSNQKQYISKLVEQHIARKNNFVSKMQKKFEPIVIKQMISQKSQDNQPEKYNTESGDQKTYQKRPASAIIYSQRKYKQIVQDQSQTQSLITLKEIINFKNSNQQESHQIIENLKAAPQLRYQIQDLSLDMQRALGQSGKIVVNKYHKERKILIANQRKLLHSHNKSDSFTLEVRPRLICMDFRKNNS